jgi:hypothetical protein
MPASSATAMTSRDHCSSEYVSRCSESPWPERSMATIRYWRENVAATWVHQ